MNRKIKKLACSFLVFILCTMQFTMVKAYSKDPSVNNEYDNVIIGGADNKTSENKKSGRTKRALPNYLTVDYDATATSIILKLNNVGLDSIDTVSGTVTAGSQTKSFTITNVRPGRMTHTVAIDMKECFEDIEVYTVAVDGGSDIGSTTTPGKRTIPLNLLLLWGAGNFATPADSINYHFREHGSELGITNIVSYVNSAQGFRTNLSGATSSPAPGATPDVTRWKKNGKYIDIHGTKNIGPIISYGRR